MERVRLGVLVPATNDVIEPDIYKMVPEGVTAHFERIEPGSFGPDTVNDPVAFASTLEHLGNDALRGTRQLLQVRPTAICFGCTSGSFFKGIEYDKNMIAKLESITDGIHVTTTSTAAVESLKELGIHKVCLITPYPDWLSELAKRFLEESGFDVPVYKGLGLGPLETAEQLPGVVYDLAVNTFRPECDGVFCACTAFRALEVIEEVERTLGKPMVSANQASMWSLLKIAGVKEPITGFGHLMKHLQD